jgi:GGDEF domain-containing protein
VQNIRKDGSTFWCLASVSTFDHTEFGQVWVSVHGDITERKQLDEQIHRMAFHDALTKLPNRRLLSDRLAQAMAISKRSGRNGAVMFLDLDNFKSLNDAHGHAVGDLLLIEVASRISSALRETDTVARFGGDEWACPVFCV